ncbi:protein kinase [Altererythrobacter arenosus]|uniref:non-specific serine/threonine protein kinase n=1 Tax=Altererythrobacter arenosus TaxID=3032592 RepID=A0ABY8FR76_9SPHN|nr:protein kinase [Altererythrobacter sp. CAU 1644]WFL77517.1 protein kinase [Altererythrobacter sp. CAU 1644]
MTKAYSTKALPPGTILREWRLEEVLGVGGFGIVYKGRGIYFDELVAIKEYFPSSISERDEESTVVPIDSDAEEVHALGLKKFVEEAKLLWNLSTPSRHPNIVSVRSLFEIHGTAYMVMDFEDGVPLNELLKQSEKFDEEKLRRMILPVAKGLERAHRVGVLHRDIKPSNILITGEGQPVLIDFGSARFETEGVTSTTVTFHTPPYAAIEQYVKTYAQGPWTDIYALGVVLYRCITGEKPAEVLERLHGEKEPALVDGDWPGYSREFLAAVDAAMIIKPTERPQSLPEWLAMFDAHDEPAAAPSDDAEDDEATRVSPMAASIDDIHPIRREEAEEAVSKVPEKIEDAEFRKVGEDDLTEDDPEVDEPTGTGVLEDAPASETAAPEKPAPADPAAKPSPTEEKPAPAKLADTKLATDKPAKTTGKGLPKPLLLGGGVLLLAGVAAWALFGSGRDEEPVEAPVVAVEEISHDDGFGPALQKLVDLARQDDLAPQAVEALERRAERIVGLESENVAIAEDPARASDVSFNRLRIADLTRASLNELAVGLSQDLTARTRTLVAAAPWADPRQEGSASGQSAQLQQLAGDLEGQLRDARQSLEDLRAGESAETALPLAQKAILAVSAFKAKVEEALAANPRKAEPTDKPTTAASSDAETATLPAASPTAAPSASGRTIDQIRSELELVARQTAGQADQVISLGRARDPGRDATEDQKKAYQTLKSNADAARDYKSYLDRLKDSMRGVSTPAEAERLLVQGRQTQSYVRSMTLSSGQAKAMLDR